mgnify:CR=1 FL=1
MRSFSRLRNAKQIKTSLGIFLIPYGLIYLCDSVLTYMFPLQVDGRLQNPYLIGFVIAFAALGSLLTDAALPTFFKRFHWKRLMQIGALTSVLFPTLTFVGLQYENIFFLFIASFISGIYYEFISYALNQFIRNVETVKEIEKDWSVVSILSSFLDFSAVLMGNLFLILSLVFSVLFVIPLQLTAILFLFLVYTKVKDQPLVGITKTANSAAFFSEFFVFVRLLFQQKTAVLLFSAVWIFDALIWTYGGIWSAEKFGLQFAWVIVAIYQIFAVVGSAIMARYPIIKNQQIYSAVTLTIANMLFLGLFYATNYYLFFLLLILGTVFHSINFPLTDTILTTLAKKNNNDGDDLIGLKRLVYSIAYIFSPIIGGFIGEYSGFSFLFGIFNITFIVIFSLLTIYFTRDFIKQKIRIT